MKRIRRERPKKYITDPFFNWILTFWVHIIITASICLIAFLFVYDYYEWRDRATENTQQTLADYLERDVEDIPEPLSVERDSDAVPKGGTKYEVDVLRVYDAYYEVDGIQYQVVYWWEEMLGNLRVDCQVVRVEDNTLNPSKKAGTINVSAFSYVYSSIERYRILLDK